MYDKIQMIFEPFLFPNFGLSLMSCYFFRFQFSPDALVTWDNLTGGEAGDSGIINMEDEDDDDLSDQVTI